MKPLLYFFLTFFVMDTLAHGSPSLPSDISGIDLVSGKPQKIIIEKAKKGVVILFLSAQCPCSASHEPTLEKLAKEFNPKGFEFIGIHSNSDESLDFARSHFVESGLTFPVIQDDHTKIADQLGALKTPHVFVFSPNGELFYQGGVDETHNGAEAKKLYLREALTAIDQGEEPSHREVRVMGCAISRF